MVRCTESTASIWQWLFQLVQKKHPLDKKREAKMVLSSAISECDEAEARMVEDLQKLSTKVKQAQQSKTINNQTKSLLINSRHKRKSLLMIQKKKNALIQQQETLDSCELNDKVLKSMRQSTAVLKDAGLDSNLKQADDTMFELEQNIETANQITSVLGESKIDESDEMDLEHELNCLLEGDFYGVIDMPKTNNAPGVTNSMSGSAVVEVREEDSKGNKEEDGGKTDQGEEPVEERPSVAVEGKMEMDDVNL